MTDFKHLRMMFDQKQQKMIKEPLCERFANYKGADSSDQQQRISDFHYTIITAKRVHDYDVIAISIVLLGKYVLCC